MKIIVNAIPLTHINTGIGRYIRCLYSEIERRCSHQVEIGYFDGKRVRSTMPRGPVDTGRWKAMIDLFWKLPPSLAFFIRRLLHARRERIFYRLAAEYDIYHETAFFPFRVPDGVKTLFTVHDLSLTRHPEWHPHERVLFHNHFYHQRITAVDHFITVSCFTANELTTLYSIPEHKITVTHLAHDTVCFQPVSPDRLIEIRARYALPDRYVLFVGSGDPRKNAGIIPKALEKSGLDIPWVLVGWQGWEDESKQNLTCHRISLDYVPDGDLPAIYGGALALIYPSLYEGFGLPVLEAMASGCPVITTKQASLPEVGGDAALYLEDPHDAGALANLFLSLSQDEPLRQRLIQKGLQQAAQFSWIETAEKTMQCMRAL